MKKKGKAEKRKEKGEAGTSKDENVDENRRRKKEEQYAEGYER
jgi:hypothetical protein